jgi:Reverse transcriptase (RNA-dependent DNA polymerase)/RNase H-like domain found in reverse transcriptase
MRDGYNRLRMAKGEEWKTAFRTRYGLFEYCVMPFGLCNAPGTFQHYMNDTFRDYLDDFLAIFLDDLLIYSKTLKEHKEHVRKILQRLQDAGLSLKLSKCGFHVTETKFLGYVISEEGISMDPAKVDSVLSWPVPQSTLDVQMFLGLENFYRRFVKGFSRLLVPITSLLKKSNTPFHWTEAANNAFNNLKKAFTSAPILRHFDYSKPAIIETDASDYATGAILSRLDETTGLLHPCAFHS